MGGEFWGDGDGTPVQRRVVFGFAGKRGELTVAVTPNRPIPDLSNISERMMLESTVPAAEAQPGQAVSPQFVFAVVAPGESEPVVYGPDHRAIPLLRLPAVSADKDDLDYAAKLEQAKAPLPPAAASAGEGAIGFLVRTDVLHFYPLVLVPEAEHEHFQEGAGSTDDLIQALPFQG
jgi:hypothetical protein